ncbi:cytochrome P450 [Xylaria sp. CBS 124048]|nr:cytochrome P450 [Xylaria sp. CBS 124048]
MPFIYDLLHQAVLAPLAIAVIKQCFTFVYILYSHPLSHIPGPLLWIAFSLLGRYSRGCGTAEFTIREMHAKSFFVNPQAWKDIYGHGHAEFPKYYPQGLKTDPRKVITANRRDHFRMRQVSNTANHTNMVHWYNLTPFDLIAVLAFGESLYGLQTGQSSIWLKGWEAHLANVERMVNARLTARKQPDRGDYMDFFLHSRGWAHRLSDDEIVMDSDLIMVAGSETTAPLLKVRDAFGSEEEMTFVETRARLPYLSAFALSISRSVPDGPPTEICGFMILPKFGRTVVGIHHFSACTSDINFHRAQEFCPERWLPGATTNPDSPFYDDYREMRRTLAKVLFHFGMRLEPSCDEWHKQRVSGLCEKPALNVHLTKRHSA